ncbi:MAG: glycerate kinase, partial [Spirochaetes bacterium]
GGGSALLPMPADGITLEEKQATTKVLLECGATIDEINSIRKHLSKIKGGGLMRLAYPANVISLILSDVVGDPLDIIASGPTVPDTSTFKDCMEIIKKYDIEKKIPYTVLKRIEKGLKGEIEETPKDGDPIFEKSENIIIGNNMKAVLAADKKARELGYNTLIISSMIEGETKEVAKVHGAIIKEVKRSGNPISPPACILSGGETTVTIKGKGKGGRNQEFVLACCIDIEGIDKVMILSGGTDGTDGPTDAAGAVGDGETVLRAKKIGLDADKYLNNNDSYHFFQKLDDLLITGPTNTNVMDLRILLIEG